MDDPGISGRRLVPQLAVGCILFTILGLLATYWIANALGGYLKTHPYGAVHKASSK